MVDLSNWELICYVPDTGGTQYNFQAPEFGDRRTLDRQQVIKNTGGGNKLVLDRGPALIFLEVTFNWLSIDQVDLMETFWDDVRAAATDWVLDVPKYETTATTAGTVDPVGAYRYSGVSFEQSRLEFSSTRNQFFGTSWILRADSRAEV